jgi:hypothetical protein
LRNLVRSWTSEVYAVAQIIEPAHRAPVHYVGDFSLDNVADDRCGVRCVQNCAEFDLLPAETLGIFQ